MGLFKKKPAVDPTELVALRAELTELRSRLEATELARGQLEDRLSALDASTTALAAMPVAAPPAFAPPLNTAELAALSTKLEHLEMQLADSAGHGAGAVPFELNAKLDALQQRVSNMPDFGGRFVELESQISAVNGRLSQVADVAHFAASTAAANSDVVREGASSVGAHGGGVDAATVARIDGISARLSELDQLSQHYQQLSQAVAGQAAIAEQVQQLSEQVQQQAHLSDHFQQLADQVGQHALIAERYQQLSEQVADTSHMYERYQQLSEQVTQHAYLGDQVAEVRQQLSDAANMAYQANERASQASQQISTASEQAARAEQMAAHAEQIASAASEHAAAAAQRADGISEQVAHATELATRAAAMPSEVPDDVRHQLQQLSERIAVSDDESRAVREYVNTLEQRMSSISVELANQIGELGRDIDALGPISPEAAAASGLSDEVIEALRTGQVRLANEQARYEIAFRQDLAMLAEQLRKPVDSPAADDA